MNAPQQPGLRRRDAVRIVDGVRANTRAAWLRLADFCRQRAAWALALLLIVLGPFRHGAARHGM